MATRRQNLQERREMKVKAEALLPLFKLNQLQPLIATLLKLDRLAQAN